MPHAPVHGAGKVSSCKRARRLQLSADALSKARALRETYFVKLEAIYNARQTLNLEAVKALLPEDIGKLPHVSAMACVACESCQRAKVVTLRTWAALSDRMATLAAVANGCCCRCCCWN